MCCEMAYRFNGGKGAVTCNECNVIFDDELSYEEYKETYGDGPDYCWRHKDKKVKKDVAIAKEAV